MIRTSAFVVACLVLGYFDARAQDRPSAFDPMVASGSDDNKCYRNARYTVVEQGLTNSVGSNVFVRYASNSRCDADSLAGDFVWRNRGGADYFLGLRGSVLFIDEGTGSSRALTLIELSTRRVLVKTFYDGDVMRSTHPGAVAVWQGAMLSKPAKGCRPPPYGNYPGVDSLYWVDIRTGKLTFAGKTRCAVRE